MAFEMDTAYEIASLEQSLYCASQRVKIAQFLIEHQKDDLLPTVLEDLFYGVQMILDNHCIVREAE
jgi:hypothetical protein